ncbi:MAG: carbohydrate ABC transporter permease [Lachnospiraceae bacterium]|nr:carbohydrate ABC transporter permease [Lachnospiraceae bacterium]
MKKLADFRDGPVRKNRAPIIIKKTVIVVVSFFVAIFFLLPTVLTFTNSFMSRSEISANYGQIFSTTDTGGKIYIGKKVDLKLIPEMVTGEQYVTVLFKSPDYLFKFWNSVFYAVPIALFQILLAMGASYAFARIEGKWKEVLFFIYIIICLMPYQVTLVPNYLVSDWLHILNTRWAIWLPGISSPFAVYLLTKHMKRIPKALYEAARVDGASELRMFGQICMPLCKGSAFSVGILIFIDYWNMVEQPLILLKDDKLMPLSVFLSKINAGEIGLAFAVAVIYMIPCILLFLYGEDYLVEGITTQGGVKG